MAVQNALTSVIFLFFLTKIITFVGSHLEVWVKEKHYTWLSERRIKNICRHPIFSLTNSVTPLLSVAATVVFFIIRLLFDTKLKLRSFKITNKYDITHLTKAEKYKNIYSVADVGIKQSK